MMTTDIHPLLATALETRDSFALGVYADWLEQEGDPLAVGWRKLAESGAWPKYDGYKRKPDHIRRQAVWFWVDAGHFPALDADLGHQVFAELRCTRKAFAGFRMSYEEAHYDTLIAAMQDAAEAWKLVELSRNP